MTSPKTCEECMSLDMTDWRGDWIPWAFEFHTHQSVNAIRANVHPNCRCRFRWAGRLEEIHESHLGFDIASLWQLSKGDLDHLTSGQLNQAYKFMRNPYK